MGRGAGPKGKRVAGRPALSDFMEANVPEADRARAGEVVVRIVNGTLFEVAQIARARAGQKPLDMTDETRAFMNQSVLALSELTPYPCLLNPPYAADEPTRSNLGGRPPPSKQNRQKYKIEKTKYV